ncbi:MAG TPA: hypothetical protein VIV61_02385, partial [Candidatus Ozemobacteraceae bacterium]
RQHRLAHEQIQEFTPTPATIGTAMHATGIDPAGRPVAVVRGALDRGTGRREIQSDTGRKQSPKRSNGRKR